MFKKYEKRDPEEIIGEDIIKTRRRYLQIKIINTKKGYPDILDILFAICY